jgi:transcription-repair coupling factor (superfamily II helicase)
MNERELEQIMLDFINGEIDVLVTTTIIETGLDIPNVNTIIIQDAEQMGLSQLYQLRGRVGRSARTAYAFLLYRRGKLLTEEVGEEAQGHPGIYGTRQRHQDRHAGSGDQGRGKCSRRGTARAHAGGRLRPLLQALKPCGQRTERDRVRKRTKRNSRPSVEADADAFIPSSYIRSEEQKLDIYKRIASVETQDDYPGHAGRAHGPVRGPIPASVNNLLLIARISGEGHGAPDFRKSEITAWTARCSKLPSWMRRHSSDAAGITGADLLRIPGSPAQHEARCRGDLYAAGRVGKSERTGSPRSMEDTLELVVKMQEKLAPKSAENAENP